MGIFTHTGTRWSHAARIIEVQLYSIPRTLGAEPTCRSRCIVVIPRPYVSLDPAGDKYEQYCRQSLMQHKPFCHMDDLLSGHTNYINAYAVFLQSGHIPPCLEDDMHCLLQLSQSTEEEAEDTEVSILYLFCIFICTQHIVPLRLYNKAFTVVFTVTGAGE